MAKLGAWLGLYRPGATAQHAVEHIARAQFKTLARYDVASSLGIAP